MSLKHMVISVDGIVQGVGFRYSTLDQARRLGLAGTVRNEDDGSVLIHAEGPAEQVDALLAWARRGPPGSRVTRIDSHEEPVKGFDSFRIVH